MNEAEKNTLKEVREKWLTELRQVGEVLNVLFPTAEHVQSPRPTRESLLERARSTRELRFNKERREQVLMIVEHSLQAAEPPSVAEIFEAAYGDPVGRDYWRLWLKYEQDEATVAKLLSTHFVAETTAPSHPLGWSWEACCHAALGRYRSAGQMIDRIKSIVDDEELGYLIPPSVRAFIESELIVGSDIAEKHPGGAPERYDWDSAEAELARECSCERCAGIPNRKHPAPDWRMKADAYRFVRDYLAKRHGADGPGETTLKERVGPMLVRIDARMKKVGN
jgi:hypothetical protein